MTTAVEAEREELCAGQPEPGALEVAGRNGGLTTKEAARLLGIQRQTLYSLFYYHRRLFQVERSGRRFLWPAQALETARALLRRRAAGPAPDGRLSTAEVQALLDIPASLLHRLRTSLGARIGVVKRWKSLRWPPEAVPLLREALAAWRRAAALASQSIVTTAEVAARLGLTVERVLALRRLHRIPARRARGGLLWEPAAIERLREAAQAPRLGPRFGPREGAGTREVAALVGMSPSRLLNLVYRFPERLPIRMEEGKLYSWTAEDVASLRALLAELPGRRDFLSTRDAATLLGIPYLRLVSLMRRRRDKLSLVKRGGFLEWSAEAVAAMRVVVARWRTSARDVRPLHQPVVIQALPGRDFILIAPLSVLLFSSRKLGVTARLADLDLQAQGAHSRDAVARLRRHLLLRYRELAGQPLQAPELWAALQRKVAPRARRRRSSNSQRETEA